MINRKPQQAPDWGLMIEDLISAGVSQADIGKAMGVDLTDRMLRHYRAGVQPAFHRGDAVVELWCKTRKKKRDDVPMIPITRGHRVSSNREPSTGPKVTGTLPSFPPVNSVAVKRAAQRRPKREPA